MTRHFQSEPEESEATANVFLQKIVARFAEASAELLATAESFDGRDHAFVKQIAHIRHVASSVARSCDAVLAILTHFESALTTPGGNDLDASEARSAGLQKLHLRGLVTAALAGKAL